MKIAIATGDPAGIGPEISLKAARDPRVLRICEPVLINSRLDLRKVKVGTVAAAHGRAALEAAEIAIRGTLAGEYDAVVAAPHTQTAIDAAGIEFDGYPSFVARTCGLAPEAGILMLCFPWKRRDVRIAHVTLHASVSEAMQLTPGNVGRTIRATSDALKKMGIEKPRIAVSGLNPHASGKEEEGIIRPAIELARSHAIVDGPIGADTLIQREGYDAYVVMLHDQGHVAAKLLAPNGAAAVTIGTPVLFSSVAHGSALDIAGKGRASPAAMVEAITRLVGRRRRSRATGGRV
ncbi:MAG TPA: 4-hydroxythreonine-4-phosphate dehydrogenase PdxA [Burkholderiales bacterium]|nr:4-hydroxythreonine-4-phosphate dehydrogenase PdxA [Burkholderiales bacterium]